MTALHSRRLFGLVLVLAFTAPVGAIPLSEVGSFDILKASAKLSNSGTSTETNWVANALGLDPSTITFETKEDCPSGGCAWQSVTGTSYTDAFALALDSDPGYFLVKTGAKSLVGPGHTHFLFENLAGLSYAVIRLSDLGFPKATITKISHVAEFNRQVEIPEPSSLALAGLALVGLGVARHSRKAAKK